MQIYISKDFSAAINLKDQESIKLFNLKINSLKKKNKTSILEMKDIFRLTEKKNIELFAYCIDESTYVLFAFKEKNEIILLDEMHLDKNNEFSSLVYPNHQTA